MPRNPCSLSRFPARLRIAEEVADPLALFGGAQQFAAKEAAFGIDAPGGVPSNHFRERAGDRIAIPIDNEKVGCRIRKFVQAEVGHSLLYTVYVIDADCFANGILDKAISAGIAGVSPAKRVIDYREVWFGFFLNAVLKSAGDDLLARCPSSVPHGALNLRQEEAIRARGSSDILKEYLPGIGPGRVAFDTFHDQSSLVKAVPKVQLTCQATCGATPRMGAEVWRGPELFPLPNPGHAVKPFGLAIGTL